MKDAMTQQSATATPAAGGTSFASLSASVAAREENSAPLAIIHVLAPGVVGGLESVVRVLSSGQRRAGHDVRVMCVLDSAGPHPYVESLERAGVDVRPVVVRGRGTAREREHLGALFAERRPDVLHTHGYRPDLVDAPVARRYGAATVSTVHGFTGGGL